MQIEQPIIKEPYELTFMDLKELQATIKTDDKGRLYADIKNTRYKQNPEFKNPHCHTLQELRIVLKLNMFNFKLKHKEIKICKQCEVNIIFDKRPFVDVCDECIKKENNNG
jgi:hypothetical protein